MARIVRRSYSICSNAAGGKLRVGIKRLPGGVFSAWAIDELRAGDVLGVMPPVGEFTIDPDPAMPGHRVAIAAGSGITPVLSLIATTLEIEPDSSWTLLYGNRTANTVMFLEELEGLKDRYPGRFQLFHLLSREGSDLPLLSGRIDDAKIRVVHDRLLGGREVDGWYLCGPYDMVMAARRTLGDLGVDEARIHDELFFAGPLDLDSLPPEPPPGEGSVDLTVILDGRAVETRMTPETSILDAALQGAIRAPLLVQRRDVRHMQGTNRRGRGANGQELRPGRLRARGRLRAHLPIASDLGSGRRPLRPPLMVTTRNSRSDVVAAAGRLFAERGYHGTSMRDLGRELGLLGSSLYAHVESKQDLLVEVVEEGARLFQDSAEEALAPGWDRTPRGCVGLVAGHVEVVLDNSDVVRTFLNEARMLDEVHRARVIAARDAYEAAFRAVVADGVEDGTFGAGTDPKMASIFILSILNAVERWYRSDGALDRAGLVDAIVTAATRGIVS